MKNIAGLFLCIFFSIPLLLAFPHATLAEEKETQAPSGDYSVEPHLMKMGDRLHITVFGVEDLTGTFQIDHNGMITMPLLNELKAAGTGKDALQKKITQRLIDEGYYNDPKVTVEIITLKPFYILGEVKNPGSYNYEPELDIFKAIAIAGGYTPRAVKDKIIIMRMVGGKKVKIEANENTPILPGDSIKVKQRFF